MRLPSPRLSIFSLSISTVQTSRILHRAGLLLLALILVAGGLAACNGGSVTPPQNGDQNGNGGQNGDGAQNGNGGQNGDGEEVFVRREINSLDPDGPEIAAFRQGISAMQARDASDPTSWLYQANIHGASQGPVEPAWNSCQHGSYFFLAWHRMYLYYFERILRAASGDPDFALPYWNYSDPANRALPLVTRQPADSSNPLWISQRSSGANAGGQLPAAAVDFSAAFAFTDFDSVPGSGSSFGGQRVSPIHGGSPHSALETTPHDQVHILVGRWMSSFTTAARDPIFWMHHANIDRLWERWLDQGGGRANPSDSAWLDTEFDFFDENGQQVTMTGSEILDTVGQLSYRYDDDPGTPRPPAPQPEPEEEGERPPSQLLAAGSGISLGGDERQSVALDDPVEESEVDPDAPLLLTVEGLEFERPPEAIYEIYVNLPAGEEAEHTTPYYVGNLSFFGIDHGGDHADHQAVLTYDITELVRRLRAEEAWSEGDYDVTFVRRTLILPPGAAVEEAEPVPITIGRISVRTE